MSIDRMMNPQPVMGQDMLIIAIIGLLINLIIFGILHSGDQKNINMRGATLHFLGDTLASIAVITAAIIIYFTEWHIIDPILSILVAIIIAFKALKLSKSATLILLEAAPEGYHIEDITNDLEKNFPQLKQIHHIHLWAISDEKVMMTFHAKTDLNHINDHTLKSIKTYLNESFAREVID
ncbi:MAG: cation diffusion facilitator family transporter [Moraxella osloensis]|nr:cation diffusion facilitator family transporter [Moraxella osloensis]